MDFLDRSQQLMIRLLGYLKDEPFEVMLELIVFWILVFVVFFFLRGTRGARVIKGVGLLITFTTLIIGVLSSESTFERLNFMYRNLVGPVSLALVIVFQPELRRALVRLGEWTFFSRSGLRKAQIIDSVVNAVAYMSKNKIGALIVIERETQLDGLIEASPQLDATVSEQLLKTIFWPGSALHDMAVLIRDGRVAAAGVQLPLAEAEQFSSELGSRHRAAYGLSLESDSLIIVVSEETGTISLAERGKLIRNLSTDALRTHLLRGLGDEGQPTKGASR